MSEITTQVYIYIYIRSYPLLMVIKPPYLTTWLCPKTGYPPYPMIHQHSLYQSSFLGYIINLRSGHTHTKRIDCWLGTSKYAYILSYPIMFGLTLQCFDWSESMFPACLINTYGTSPVQSRITIIYNYIYIYITCRWKPSRFPIITH